MSVPSVDNDMLRGELRYQTKRADSQTERADMLLRRKDAYYALLVRVALCRELFAQLPADLQADIRAVVGDLIQ